MILSVRIAGAIALISLVAILSSQPAPREQVGPLPGGAFLLNSGWVLDPVGKQVPVDTLPMSSALSPDGKYLLVLNGGYRPPSITVIDTASATVKTSVPAPDAWLGIAFTPRGDRVYVGGGSKASVFEFTFADGTLTAARTFPVPSLDHISGHDMIGDVALSPDGRVIVRRRPVSRFGSGHQSAVGHDHRPHQDRPPAIPHPVSSRWQFVLRHQLGRWNARPLRRLERQPNWRVCRWARTPPIWCGATAPPPMPMATT